MREEAKDLENISENNCEIVTFCTLTSFTDKTTFDVCMDIGIKEYINKPINCKQLLRIVLKYFFKLTNE
jgi:response regulator RpfG family c-di-GMP phosphodiesterase